ncbi:MAG: IS3 family transposase [Saprospiraceae bacterium]|nr:IS3 family transposase [Saprospiraceae bacterium]
MMDRSDLRLSLRKQCEILGIHKSALYYKPVGESELNLEIMRLVDEHYLEHPYKGARRMHVWLKYDKGYDVSLNRIERLYYRLMCLRSLLPGPHTSKRNKEHKVYPYLLNGVKVVRPNQVWQTDITYIPMANGFMYLTAVIDVFSRRILAWNLSNTMDAELCRDVIAEAVEIYGAPEIINTDQGSQYTSEIFTDYVSKLYTTKLSMDGKGRATDNAYIERFWRSIKYEHIYLNPTNDVLQLYRGLDGYIKYYNSDLRQRKLNNQTPEDVFDMAA